jgi:hypothetical protein
MADHADLGEALAELAASGGRSDEVGALGTLWNPGAVITKSDNSTGIRDAASAGGVRPVLA